MKGGEDFCKEDHKDFNRDSAEFIEQVGEFVILTI